MRMLLLTRLLMKTINSLFNFRFDWLARDMCRMQQYFVIQLMFLGVQLIEPPNWKGIERGLTIRVGRFLYRGCVVGPELGLWSPTSYKKLIAPLMLS